MSTCLMLRPMEGAGQTLILDEGKNQAYVNGQVCTLTQQEFNLLQELAEHVNKPVSREQLLKDAWGYVSPGDTRTVDVHVQRLRRKLGFTSIETIYRFGYRLRAVTI